MFDNFIPAPGFILAKVIKQEQKTESGIFLTAPTNNNVESATFIKANYLTDLSDAELDFGATIYYKKYVGTMLDDELIVLKEEDIFGYTN